MEVINGSVTAVNGNLVSVRVDGSVKKNEVGYILVGDKKLKGENYSIPNDNYDDNKIIKPILIGDTVKEWTCRIDSEELPIDVPSSANNGTGEGQIIDNFGRNDDCSLQFNVKVGNNNKGYLGSDALKNPFFLENDAKNGDIISFYYYVEANRNVESLQLQVLPSSMNGNGILGDVINIDETKQDKWIRTLVSFDTLETLGAIRINYTAIDAEKEVSFYIDDINIELGVETVKTDYEYNEESLCQTYEDYFKVGTCMSINQVRNTECRKIVKDNFNSITAENEGKPEQILDQAACQELAKAGDKSGVAIKVTPFEKIYDFAEANHIGVRHHTFVWYSQTPAWFFNEGYENNGNKVSKETMLKRMENFIKECKNEFGFRYMSSTNRLANELRLQIDSIAYAVLNLFRRICLPKTWIKYRVNELRLRIMRIAGKVVRTSGKVIFKLCEHYPYKKEFIEIYNNIAAINIIYT